MTAFCDGGYTTNLPARGRHRRQGVDRVSLRRRAARSGARRSGPAARAAPLFLEEREMGSGPPARRRGRAGLLGVARLPRVRRSLAGTAVLGRLTWRARRGCRGRRRDTPRQDDRPRRARLARASGRPTRRRPSHGRGRLPGPAELLDRLGAGGRAARAHGRAARRRRGLALPRRRAPAGRPARAAGADRRLLRLGTRTRRAPAARRGRLRDRAADVDAAAPRGGRERPSPCGSCTRRGRSGT